jgi:flagellar assembly factor FliW
VYWLTCADEPAIAMPVAEAFVVEPSYSFNLSDHDQQLLGLEDSRDALVYAVLTVARPQGTITANLLAPVVYNLKLGTAKQLILDDGRYDLRHPVKSL